MSTIRLNLRKQLFLVGVLAELAGCGGARPAAPADPDQARDALRVSLDAWQQGETPDTLKQRQPAIHVVDYQWSAGQRLIRYQIATDERVGNQLRCRVRLTIQNKQGRIGQELAAYSVSTDPVLTVHHDDF